MRAADADAGAGVVETIAGGYGCSRAIEETTGREAVGVGEVVVEESKRRRWSWSKPESAVGPLSPSLRRRPATHSIRWKPRKQKKRQRSDLENLGSTHLFRRATRASRCERLRRRSNAPTRSRRWTRTARVSCPLGRCYCVDVSRVKASRCWTDMSVTLIRRREPATCFRLLRNPSP